jgi:hypothetical protein
MHFLLRLVMAMFVLSASPAFAEPIGRVQFVAGVVNLESTGGSIRPLKKGDSIGGHSSAPRYAPAF